MSSFHYHLCQHSLAYWINGNEVVAISRDVANTWEVDTPVKFQ